MIRKIAKLSATASYSFAKLSPFANGLTLATVLAMYTGLPWIISMLVLIFVCGCAMAFFHFSGLFKAEQKYVVGELGMGEDDC